jgi:threonine/homoserine/homoserine lactone efflux protein
MLAKIQPYRIVRKDCCNFEQSLDMLVAIVIGTLIGFVLAIPPGPIGMAAIRMGLRDGWGPSVRLALGAGLFDTLYCGLAMIATGYLSRAFDDLEHSSPLIPVALQLAIVLAMIVFGWLQIRERAVPPASTVADMPPIKRTALQQWMRSHGPFFVGVGFALANLANPTFIPALSLMTTAVQSSEWYVPTTLNNLLFSVTFGIGNVAWLTLLSRFVIRQQHRMTPTLVRRIHQLSGLTLIGFGTMFGVRIVATTKWPELLRLLFSL